MDTEIIIDWVVNLFDKNSSLIITIGLVILFIIVVYGLSKQLESKWG